MKKTILRFGLYAALCELLFFIGNEVIFGINCDDVGVQEVVGYLGILVCVSFVYFGIRYYRDKVNGGTVTFVDGLKLGLIIMLIPSVCFGLTDTIYVVFINPHFFETYSAHMFAEMKRTTPAADVALKTKELKAQMELFKKPYMNFLVMFFTVASMGIIVTLISAFVLKRKPVDSPVI